MKKLFIFLALLPTVLILQSCTKDVPKEMQNNRSNDMQQMQNPHTQNQDMQNQDMQNQDMQNRQMPDDSIHRNLMNNHMNSQNQDNGDTKGDKVAEKMTTEADDADARYQRSNNDADKKVCIEKQLSAANYLMFEANLSPKKKYRPALQRYRRVLELDPKNSEALENKKQIEDIYKSMGMPIPD